MSGLVVAPRLQRVKENIVKDDTSNAHFIFGFVYLGGSMREISLEALGFCQVTKGGYQRKTLVP